MHFKDKNILIVGGNSGIGLDTVNRLIEQGANIWVASRHPVEGTQASAITPITVDVTKDDVKQAFTELPETLHGFVYCPGTITLKPFHGLKAEQWQNDWEVNVMGAVNALQAALKPLKKSGDAAVVLYSTVAAQVGMPYHASIASAKAALEGMGKSLAAELVKSNVRVNIIAPSLTDSPLAESLLSTEEKKEASRNRHPLGRYGETGDIAGLTTYLLAAEASWITGQVFPVDGGLSGVRSV